MPGEKITVIYRGPERLVETARVIRMDEAIGYVDQVLTDRDHKQRVIIIVRQASVLTDKDQFRIFDDEQGKKGFRVVPGDGAHLAAGMEVEANPTWSKREYYAAMTTTGELTLPSGTPLPYPRALTGTPTPHSERIEKDFQKSIQREMEIKKKRNLNVDGSLLGRYRLLEEAIKGKSPEEVKLLIDAEAEALKRDLESAVADARRQKSMDSFRDHKELLKRLERLEVKTNRALERLAIEAKKPKREPYVPPDFR